MHRSYSKILTKPLLEWLCVDLEKTDIEISGFLNLDRTTIVHARNEFGIVKPKTTGRNGELLAKNKLENLGYKVKDMNENDKLSIFDLLINDRIRIKVKSANSINNSFYFALTEQESKDTKVSEARIKLSNGRTKKVFTETCDLIVFVGITKQTDYNFWIIPPSLLPEKIQTVHIPVSKRSKYYRFYNAFNLIEGLL